MNCLLTRKPFCILVLLLLSGSVNLSAQEFFFLDANSTVYKTTAGGTCSSVRLSSCVTGITDIAYYRDTLYSITYDGMLYRSLVSKPAVPCVLVARFNTIVNSLAVDNAGTVYAAGLQKIMSYQPLTGKVTVHGSMNITFSSSGDLTFYEGKLYVAANISSEANVSCLIEVNIANPALSTVFMRLKSKDVFGCITLPKSCDANGFYITGTSNSQSVLTEIDMVNKIELSPTCTYNTNIYGAASFTEGGSKIKPQLDSIRGRSACSNDASSGSMQIFARNSGSLLTYALNGAASNQTGLFTNLAAGRYTIRVTSELNCSLDTAFTISTALPPSYNTTATDPFCSNSNGKIAIQSLMPGASLQYALNNGAYQRVDSFGNLAAGKYFVAVKNETGCVTEKTVVLTAATLSGKNVSIRSVNPGCLGSEGSINVSIQNTGQPVSYTLNGNASSTGVFGNLPASNYTLSVKAGSSCSFDTVITLTKLPVTKPLTEVRKTGPSCPSAPDGSFALVITGSEGPYAVSVNNGGFSATYAYPALAAGDYALRIQNKNGCLVDSLSVQLAVTGTAVCNFIHFPNAFTPNRDGRNDLFGPVVYGVLEKYKLMVYNRFGQKVFETTDPKKGWNGEAGGVPQATGAFVWVSSYKFSGADQREKADKGTVMVIR